MRLELLVAFSVLTVAAAFPGKLLRVPKIYNALITTKEKLLPSEAYPATTGPIFQPIAFTGEPILLNANEFINSANRQRSLARGNESEEDEKNMDKPSPVVFYPRYGLYYPHHTVVSYVNTLQHSFVYTAVDHSKGAVKVPIARTEIARSSNLGDGFYIKTPRRVKEAEAASSPGPISYMRNDDGMEKEVR